MVEKYQRKTTDENGSVLCTMFFRGVPRALRQAFKARCALNGVDMKDKIILWIRQYVGGGEGGK